MFFWTFICPCIASISLKYNQQDAMFCRSIYFYKFLYMFQAVSPPIIRSTKLYIQRQVLSNQHCCLLLSWVRWNFVPSHPYTCFRRFLRPSSGVKNCTYSVRYCQTNTAACCYRGWDGTSFHIIHTWRCMLYSWWWAEKAPETCRAIYRNK
jgi:hypothetical protein